MSDDAIVCIGYTVNTVALCSLGCCYGHRVVQSRFVEGEPSLLEDASGCGFANFGITLDPYHFQFMPNEISQLAKDVAAALRKEGRPVLGVAPDELLEEFVQDVLDKTEAVGGFDFAEYDETAAELDDDEDDEDEFTDDELDDRWDGDEDDEDDEDPDTI